MMYNQKHQNKKPHFVSPQQHPNTGGSYSDGFFQPPTQKQVNPDALRNKKWNGLLRLGALVASILGMFISAQFSVDGFSFNVPGKAWIGWGIAAILILIESVWQKFGNNKTLFVLAMVCYAYGIVTNIVGIIQNRGGYDGNPWSLVVPIAIGLLLEVFPEPVLAWSISGDTSSDPIGAMMEKAADTDFVGHVYNIPDSIKERLGK